MADAILNVIGRKEAKALGLKRYFTGVPCVNGHSVYRLTATGVCSECVRIRSNKYLSRDGERERQKVRVDRRYQENKEEVNARAVVWRKRNPEKVRISNLKSVKSENHKKATKNWRKNHPEMVRVHYQNKRAKRKRADGKHTLKDVLRILGQQKGRCANCAASVKDGYHVDHVMPISKGGSNWSQNLQILCPPCNTKKNSKLPEEWARENGRLL